MNSSNGLPFKKRNSAFDTTPRKEDQNEVNNSKESQGSEFKSPFSSTKSKSIFAEEAKQEVKPEIKDEKTQQTVIEETPKVEVKQEIKEEKVVKTQQIQKQSTKKVALKEDDDPNREKYTATMEKSLRKRVKIAAIEMGLQVSSFIEEACKEKLEREGH